MRPWTAVSFSTSARCCRRSLARISVVSRIPTIVHCGTLEYVQLRYNFRVYPTSVQQQSLARAFGCARVVFNDALRARQQARADGLPYLSDAELSKRVTAAKLTRERASPARERRDEAEEQIRALAGKLAGDDAFVIFPEGANFTPHRWRRAIARLRG